MAETTIRLNESRFKLVLSNLFNISIKDGGKKVYVGLYLSTIF